MPGNVHKKFLHDIHFDAWKKGMKSMYYCRSTSIQRAEKVSHKISSDSLEIGDKENSNDNMEEAKMMAADDGGTGNNYDECLACQ